MRENGRAPGVELGVSKTPTVSIAPYIMHNSPIREKPAAWTFRTSDSMALDRLVEVALSAAGAPDSSLRNNARDSENQLPYVANCVLDPKPAGARDGTRGLSGDGDSAEKRRYCFNNGIKLAKPAATSTPPQPSPSPSSSSAVPNHQPAGCFQQQPNSKLKRRLSSFGETSKPASSSLRVRVEHPHAKRFKLSPRFKALVDISC